jgi:hypothetical protein
MTAVHSLHDAIDEANQFGSVTTTGINRFMYLRVEHGLQFILKIQ